MWVKLVTPTLSVAEETRQSCPNSCLIPIRWIVRQRPSENESDLMTGNPSEKETLTDPVEEKAGVRNAEAKPMFNALALPRSPSATWSSAACATVATPKAEVEGDEDGADLCVVCMARPPDFQLLPCLHDRFCRQCIVETICTWKRQEAPSCPLCRGPFHTMVMLE